MINITRYKPTDTWQVKIRFNGKQKHCGYFKNYRAAVAARDFAIKRWRTTNVTWHKRAKSWQVKFSLNGCQIHLGYFKNYDKAVEARNHARKNKHERP